MRSAPLSVRIVVTGIAALTLVSCSSDSTGTPADAVSSFFDGIFAKNCKQAHDAMVAKSAKELKCAEVTKLGAYIGKGTYKIGKTVTKGDKATVTLTFKTKEFGANTSTINVVKEKGEWKVDPGTKEATTLP